MIKRVSGLAHRGFAAYVRTVRDATPNARRYLLVVVLQNMAMGVLGTAFALYIRAAGMSTAVVGDVEGALALAAGIVCLVLPPLVASVGYRSLLVVAGLAFAASRLGQTLGVGPSAIVALGLAYGVGDGIMRCVGVAFLSENGPAGSERTLLFTAEFALRIFSAFVGALLGGLVPTVLAGAVPEAEALRWTIVLAGVLFLASSTPALGIREKPRPTQGVFALYVSSVRGFRSWRRLASLAIPEAIMALGAGLIMPFVPLLLRTHLGASVAQVGLIQGATSLAMAAAILLSPLLVRRVGLVGAVVFPQLISLPFLMIIPLATSLPVVVFAMLIRTAFMNMTWPAYNQIAVEGIPSRDRPFVLGWIAVAWSMAWLVGSAVGGRLAVSSYTTGYFVTFGLYAAGAIATWLLLRGEGFRAEPSAEGLVVEVAEPRA